MKVISVWFYSNNPILSKHLISKHSNLVEPTFSPFFFLGLFKVIWFMHIFRKPSFKSVFNRRTCKKTRPFQVQVPVSLRVALMQLLGTFGNFQAAQSHVLQLIETEEMSDTWRRHRLWVVVSIFHFFQPITGMMQNFDSSLSTGLKPPTSRTWDWCWLVRICQLFNFSERRTARNRLAVFSQVHTDTPVEAPDAFMTGRLEQLGWAAKHWPAKRTGWTLCWTRLPRQWPWVAPGHPHWVVAQ